MCTNLLYDQLKGSLSASYHRHYPFKFMILFTYYLTTDDRILAAKLYNTFIKRHFRGEILRYALLYIKLAVTDECKPTP